MVIVVILKFVSRFHVLQKERRVVSLFSQDQKKLQTFTILVKSEGALPITQLNMPQSIPCC